MQRLEARGWISAEWGLSDNNRKARFYMLTRLGRKQLVVETRRWRRLAARSFEGMLFGVTPLDPAAFASVALGFATIATLAALGPARRATTMDPIVALRSD